MSSLAGRGLPLAGDPALGVKPEGVIDVMLYPEAATLPPVVVSKTADPRTTSLQTVNVFDTPTGMGLTVTVTVKLSPTHVLAVPVGVTVYTTCWSIPVMLVSVLPIVVLVCAVRLSPVTLGLSTNASQLKVEGIEFPGAAFMFATCRS